MSQKILFISQEIEPFVPKSFLSERGRAMPVGMQEEGCEVRIFMPKWGNINERRGQLHEVIRLSGINLIIDDTDHPLIIKVASIPQTRLQVYFIDNDDYFMKRQMAIDEKGEEYNDNGERAIFFARGVLETVKKLRWIPDIIHCQGWITSIVPLYVKLVYNKEPAFSHTKIVTSFFKEGLQKKLGTNFKNCLIFRNIDKEMLRDYKDDFDFEDMMRLAVDYSDAIAFAEEDIYSLSSYAKSKGIPVKETGDNLVKSYKKFYEQIINK